MNIIKNLSLAVLLGQLAATGLNAQKSDPDAATGVPTAKVERPRWTQPIDMSIAHNHIFVTGQPLQPVALLAGLDQASFYVGKAHIKLLPLLILDLGRFDASGEYRWSLPLDAGGGPITVLVQAFSWNDAGYTASELWRVDYHGGGRFDGNLVVDHLAFSARRGFEASLAATRRLAA